ncbi:MAG: AtpZ/AtpI family protein [Armatimonadota bacterium]
MNDLNFTPQPDREGELPREPKPTPSAGHRNREPREGEPISEGQPYEMPELPPIPELPKPPEVRFERPKLEPWRTPRMMEASRGVAIAFSIGFALAGPILVGTLLGIWLDNRFNTSPWLTLILLLVGLAAGFTHMIRLLNRLQGEQRRKP